MTHRYVNVVSTLLAFGFLWMIVCVCGCRDTPEPPPNRRLPPGSDTEAAAKTRDPQTIILVADVWPPYNCAPQDSNEGYMVDVAREIFSPLGYDVQYSIVPWKRALSGTLDGNYDGAIGTSKVEGEGLVFPELELLRNQVSFFVRSDSPWRFEGEDSLTSVRLGAAHGYDYVGWLNAYLVRWADEPNRVQIITGYDPLAQNLKKLLAGRIDVMAGNQGTILHGALQMGLTPNIQLAGQDPEVSNCYIAFSPSTETGQFFADTLDQGLVRLRANGRFSEILQKYGLTDWAP